MVQIEGLEVEAEVGEGVAEEVEGVVMEEQRVERSWSPRLCPNY